MYWSVAKIFSKSSSCLAENTVRPLCGLITLSSMKRKPRVSVAFEGRESAEKRQISHLYHDHHQKREQSIRIYIIVSKFICIINVYHRCLCFNSYKRYDQGKSYYQYNNIVRSLWQVIGSWYCCYYFSVISPSLRYSVANSGKALFFFILDYALIIIRCCQDTKIRGKIAFQIPRYLCEKFWTSWGTFHSGQYKVTFDKKWNPCRFCCHHYKSEHVGILLRSSGRAKI